MGSFGIVVAVGLGMLIVALLLIGRYYPGSGADVVDWKPTRSVELEAELEVDDLDQMLAAQNERRRRRGLQERSLEDVELDVARDLREQHGRRRDYRAALEASDEAQSDLVELLTATNDRRRRRGQPPLSLEQLRSEVVPPPSGSRPPGAPAS